MSTDLVAISAGFSQEQIDVIKRTIAPAGTTDAELSLFLMVAQKTGLDPFSRQIYFSERKSQVNGQWTNKKTPETTIDGFRVIAERSGVYGGQLGPFWCAADGLWKDVWLSDAFPSAAKVGIIRKDFQEPLWGIALFDEYVQRNKEGQPNSMWTKMGANQLAKCAEALGLRKAFPRDLSGMYSREEMAQSFTEEPAGSRQAQIEVINRKLVEAGQPPAFIEANPTTAPLEGSTNTLPKKTRNKVPVGAKRTKSDISLEALKGFRHLKLELSKLTESETVYYDFLKSHGFEHSDQIPAADARSLWKELAMIRAKLQQDAELKALLIESQLTLPQDIFYGVLGQFGFENIEDFIGRADGDTTTKVLTEMKSEVDARRPK